MKKPQIRLIVIILIISIFFQITTTYGTTDNFASASAKSVICENNNFDRIVMEEILSKKNQGISEIESLRTENSKHFLLEDGSIEAVIRFNPVHRKMMKASGSRLIILS